MRIVRGRVSQTAAAKMIEAVTRCMEPLAEVTKVAAVSFRFHPISMMLVLRPAEEEPTVREVVDVEEHMGQTPIRGDVRTVQNASNRLT